MKALLKRIIQAPIAFLNRLKSKIAFYPSLMAIVGFCFSLFVLWIESFGVSQWLHDFVPVLALNDADTAKTVLSVCIGGLISMMVFSFSMVMLLLSQASSNFSPRILPGLISNRENQLVLGAYIATIVYCIFSLFNIEVSSEDYLLPGFSILLGILATLFCFGAFIYFIHNISQSIQINNILDSIYDKAKYRLKLLLNEENEADLKKYTPLKETGKWNAYPSPKVGYLQSVALSSLHKLAEELDTQFYISIPRGMFVLDNVGLIYSSKAISDDELERVHATLTFDRSELVDNNYLLAFKQIIEIILKAMSPGVNDPGTALNGLDYLTTLFAMRQKKVDHGLYVEDEQARVQIAVVTFDELLSNTMAAFRTYCCDDPIIMQKMFWMLAYLKDQPCIAESYRDSVLDQIKRLQGIRTFDNPKDQEMMSKAREGIPSID